MGEKAGVRSAVIGASGIGKHHAKWWHLEGADVCAFVGTSRESVAKTQEALAALFPFEGRGYTDVQAMLDAEGPDVVDVCSPAPCHYEHVRTALEAGCQVLCEKPLVFDKGVPREALMAQGRALFALADDKGGRLGVCTQYSSGALIFGELWGEQRNDEPITHYHGHLEAPAKGRAPDPARIWVDLSPHLISVLLKLAPGGAVAWDTLRAHFDGYEATAEFEVRRAAGGPLECVLVARNRTEPPPNIRHFKLNDYPFVVEGENDADGVYCARIETPDGHHLRPDLMRVLIGEFLAGRLVTNAEESLANLDLMLRVLEAGAQ